MNSRGLVLLFTFACAKSRAKGTEIADKLTKQNKKRIQERRILNHLQSQCILIKASFLFKQFDHFCNSSLHFKRTLTKYSVLLKVECKSALKSSESLSSFYGAQSTHTVTHSSQCRPFNQNRQQLCVKLSQNSSEETELNALLTNFLKSNNN